MKQLLIRFGLFAFLLGQFAIAQQQQSATTVVLVRHAEKASNQNTPEVPLSVQGQQRAECLARVLKDAGIKRIYVSDAKRTQQTAEPLAKELGIKPVVVPAKDSNTLVRDVFYGNGGNALVVGHSNTLPGIIKGVQAGTIAPLGENEYDAMYVLTVLEGSSTPVVKLRYCAASPASSTPANMSPEKTATPAKKKK
ncbi:MAG TPA: phosphoglycerate mutase family protein [Candidatus Angelobacter sp.]|nr:phosphoglycerate mutase family protein [Candidatus Angelobacter sp.]